MLLKKKNRFKPFYKQFVRLRENIQNRKKLLQFKKKKWKKFIQNYKKKLKRWKKIKPRDSIQYLVSRYPNRVFSYKKRYRNTLHEIKKLNLFYGGMSKKSIKKIIKKTINKKNKKINSLFLELFESRLDIILYRSKFCLSIKNARQLILHGKVIVNNKTIKIKSYRLKPGDLISINFRCYSLIETNFRKCEIWPIPPKHLTINYKSMQINFGTFKNINLSLNLFYRLNFEKILNSYYQH